MINLNSRNCFVSKDPSYFVYSDANATGGGAFLDLNDDFVCHKVWTENESLQSSTWRELSVIANQHYMNFHCNLLPHYLDDRTLSGILIAKPLLRYIFEVGSMKLDLHRIARNIFSICIQSGIHLEAQWIPRSLNQQADYISRLIDTDD